MKPKTSPIMEALKQAESLEEIEMMLNQYTRILLDCLIRTLIKNKAMTNGEFATAVKRAFKDLNNGKFRSEEFQSLIKNLSQPKEDYIG